MFPTDRRGRIGETVGFVGVLLAIVLSGRPAVARRNGIAAPGCTGCHGDLAQSTVSLRADSDSIQPGGAVTFTVGVQRAGAQVGGVFVADPGIGQLSTIAGEGLAQASAGLTHTAPRPAVNGLITFRFGWRAPNQPGAVRFEVYGNAANGDGTPNGDAPGSGVFPFTFGCTPQTFHFDADGDGFGADLFAPTVACAGQPAPLGYSANRDDCDDSHDTVHPGALELCNGRDDNCNGAIDEGAMPEELWPDEDGDGYYGAKTGTPVMGCLPLAGYAADPGDCAPRDATRHPGAIETCNLLDDNCNGRVDEGLRPQCGVGLCRRSSVTCDFADCVPGVPAVEVCNLLDDDCDGQIDEGDLCRSGFACVNGECVVGAVSTAGSDAGEARSGGGAALSSEGGRNDGKDAGPIEDPSASAATAACAMVRLSSKGGRGFLSVCSILMFVIQLARRRAARGCNPPRPARRSCAAACAIAVGAVLAFSSCTRTRAAPPSVNAPPEDAERMASGLFTKVLAPGSGHEHPEESDRVKVHYTGWLRDGSMFDSSLSRGEPGVFTLTQMIAGWTEALKLMVAGEKRRLWVPASLAYGEKPPPGVPAGDLMYDVELVEIIRSPRPPEDVQVPPKAATVTASGLAYRVLARGTGQAHPGSEDTVIVQYSGWTTDALLFDSSLLRNGPMSFALDSVIAGFREAVQSMVVGEKARFWVPAHLAYGDHPTEPDVPAGMLVYDIELLQIR